MNIFEETSTNFHKQVFLAKHWRIPAARIAVSLCVFIIWYEKTCFIKKIRSANPLYSNVKSFLYFFPF